jgi:glycosyltransferase involved in cell wall biosynthesis
MTRVLKLLVLSSFLPGGRHGGGVVMDEILGRYPKDRYVYFAVNAPDNGFGAGELPESLQEVPWVAGPLIPRPRLRGARFYLPLLRALGLRVLARRRVQQAVAFGKRHGVDLVWAELQGDAVAIAQKVAAGLKVPFVGTVWDDPEGWLADGGYDCFSRQLLLYRFREALSRARFLSTAGEAMQQVYEKEYGVKSVILRHGFEAPVLPPTKAAAHQEIVIGFVGNAYGRETWTAFLQAVARLNATGALPPIRLKVFGPGFPYRQPGVEVDNRGWQPAAVMLRQIAETDFCYLQCWFDPGKRRHAELSFPNKLQTYLAAGRPILFHGPVYAGIAETVRKYGFGLCLHSLDEEQISTAIGRLIVDQPLRESFSRAALAAFHAEFNATKMLTNFAELIGVSPDLFLGKSPE